MYSPNIYVRRNRVVSHRKTLPNRDRSVAVATPPQRPRPRAWQQTSRADGRGRSGRGARCSQTRAQPATARSGNGHEIVKDKASTRIDIATSTPRRIASLRQPPAPIHPRTTLVGDLVYHLVLGLAPRMPSRKVQHRGEDYAVWGVQYLPSKPKPVRPLV